MWKKNKMEWLVILAYFAVALFIYRLCIINAATKRALAFNEKEIPKDDFYFDDNNRRRLKRGTLTWEEFKAGERGYSSYTTIQIAEKLNVAFRVKAVWCIFACLFWPLVGVLVGAGYVIFTVVRFLISKGSALTLQSWISVGENKATPKEQEPVETTISKRSRELRQIINSDPDLLEASKL